MLQIRSYVLAVISNSILSRNFIRSQFNRELDLIIVVLNAIQKIDVQSVISKEDIFNMSEPLQPILNQPFINNTKPIKTIKLWKEVLIILGCALIVFSAGQYVGKKYFWNQFDKTPLVEKQYQSALTKVKQTPNDPNSHIDYGWALYQKGQYNEALAEYKKATDLDDKNFRAYLNLGIAYRQVEKKDIAASTFQKAIELSPKSYEAHYYLGLTFQTNGKLDQAIQELELADKLHPGSSQIMYDIGQTKEKMGDSLGAQSEYKYALQYDPNFSKAQEALSRLGGSK